ncbi:LANO_0D03378g1_1 [Lachancea nothofagi CBS 11611]|uniref:Pre-mRNA-splicing factor SYF1 n=1 Tax=Lachancea nothofagi CBS 11611 TaxID=1266666 RepID=A0A1G4JF57_9SACH|nr:LANO_0D03378g1_1 [Lachancea nothofagi CBS 11611]
MDPSITQYVATSEDLAYEYELQSNIENMVVWKRYLDHRKSVGSETALAWVYERCCYQFPSSREMWMEYMQWRTALLSTANAVVYLEEFEKCNKLFEKAMYLCHPDPNLWELYLRHCIRQLNMSLIRRVLNQALRCVALESHIRVWSPVIEFIETTLQDLESGESEPELDAIIEESFSSVSQTSNSITPDIWSSHLLSRYIKITDELEHVLYLVGLTRDYHIIADLYCQFIIGKMSFKPVDQPLFQFYDLYLEAIENIGEHQQYLQAIAQCMEMFPDQSSKFVTKLSKYYLRRADFTMARSVLQDALSSTTTSRAFSEVYDFLIKLLESFVSACIHEAQATEDLNKQKRLDADLSYNIDLLEHLMETHSMLINDLKLRQDINDVSTWTERISMCSSPEEKLEVYTDAILKIDPLKVSQPGALGRLWCGYAQLYNDTNQIISAREAFDRGLRVPYKFLQDIEIIWQKWAEMEVNCGRVPDAVKLLEAALSLPRFPEMVLEKYNSGKGSVPAKAITFTSTKLWSFYIDLLEASSDIAKTLEAYEKLIALKLATPLHFLNYAQFLQGQQNWNGSFKIYERAITIFPAETSFELWSFYLKDSLEQSRPTETIRELFEQALSLAQNGIDCAPFFIQYSDFEHSQGLDKRSVGILTRGCMEIKDEASKVKLWALCLDRCKEYLGLESARSLYEKCIQTLPNSKVIAFVLGFAQIEESLSNIERARAVMNYGAHLLHPAANVSLWDFWSDFELRHGDKTSYKEMLRMKRELNDTMKISTEEVSKQTGNIQFVSSTVGVKNDSSHDKDFLNTSNPEEISLDI